jgi:hypothetical protein
LRIGGLDDDAVSGPYRPLGTLQLAGASTGLANQLPNGSRAVDYGNSVQLAVRDVHPKWIESHVGRLELADKHRVRFLNLDGPNLFK